MADFLLGDLSRSFSSEGGIADDFGPFRLPAKAVSLNHLDRPLSEFLSQLGGAAGCPSFSQLMRISQSVNHYATRGCDPSFKGPVIEDFFLNNDVHTSYVPPNHTPILRAASAHARFDESDDESLFDFTLVDSLLPDAAPGLLDIPLLQDIPLLGAAAPAQARLGKRARRATKPVPAPAPKRSRKATAAPPPAPAPPPPPQSPPAALAPQPKPKKRRPTASWRKQRCSPEVFLPGAQFGVCGFCAKLLMYDEPPHKPGQRLAFFGRHRGTGKGNIYDCEGSSPAFYEQWRLEDYNGAPRTMAKREAPPPLSEVRYMP